MSDTNPLSLALDRGSELAEVVRAIQIVTTFFSLWAGCLGWDLFYYFLWDVELLFSSGWSSPVRALTRASYLLSRVLAFASLVLSLLYWAGSWSENACIVLPFVYEGILVFSYFFTIVVLALRTLSLYPGNSRPERVVQCVAVLGAINVLIWGGIHVKEAGGHRMPGTKTRCGYAEDALGLFLIRGMLVATVIFNTIMFSLTLYKIYISGSQHFFNRKTIIGRIFNLKSSSPKEKEPAGNQLAASLITQGLWNFFVLLIVDIAALICCIVLTSDLYRQMTVISLAAFSSVLAGGLFRETFRGAQSIAATQQLEMRLMEVRVQAEKRDPDFVNPMPHGQGRPAHEEIEEVQRSFDQRSQSQATERSIAHPNWNSEVETSSVENLQDLDGESIVPRSSTESKGYDSPGRDPNSNFDQVPHLNHWTPGMQSSNGPIPEPHPFASYSNPIRAPALVMGMSLHAFNDGASTRSNTLGEISILGAGWRSGNLENIEMSRTLPPPARPGKRRPQ